MKRILAFLAVVGASIVTFYALANVGLSNAGAGCGTVVIIILGLAVLKKGV